jgi:hypothetical protein
MYIQVNGGNWSSTGRTVDVHRLLVDWTEQATWNCPDDTKNIDKTPPSVEIASPLDGAILDTFPVTVTGTVTDVLSSIASVNCNENSASLSGSDFSCEVSPIEGASAMIIQAQATDLAGNIGSTTIL